MLCLICCDIHENWCFCNSLVCVILTVTSCVLSHKCCKIRNPMLDEVDGFWDCLFLCKIDLKCCPWKKNLENSLHVFCTCYPSIAEQFWSGIFSCIAVRFYVFQVCYYAEYDITWCLHSHWMSSFILPWWKMIVFTTLMKHFQFI